jgi:signal peptidase I
MATTGEFKKSIAREYFESLVIAVVLALFIRTFVVQAFKIPTGSMEPNLLIGDHLLVNKFVTGPTTTSLERAVLPIEDIHRKDVIVFKYPKDPERDFIKRVIGLPGETVELRNKRVFINGQRLDEPYVFYLEDPPPIPQETEASTELLGASGDPRVKYGPVTVPAGHYFAMGDNRDNSEDSRYWGFLPRENIKGRALVIYWSYDAEPDDAQGGTLPAILHMFTRTRWNRLFHQVR